MVSLNVHRSAQVIRFFCGAMIGLLLLTLGCRSPGGNRLVDFKNRPQEPSPSAVTDEAGTTLATNPAAPAKKPIGSFASLGRLTEKILWPRRDLWRRWGNENLRSGDIVFIRGNYRMLLGIFNLSEFLSEVGDSPFSHVGIVIVEQGKPMVYDISDQGLKRQPFEKFLTSSKVDRVAVRRLAPSHQHAVMPAVAYVRNHHQRKTGFDKHFELGDKALYCSEMIVEGFKQGGVTLAQPIPAGKLPGLENVHPAKIQLVKLATGLDEDDLILLPGNHGSGIFGSSALISILESTELR